MWNIADDSILVLTGIPCVGKTSAAYKILQKYPAFRRVSETDIIRTIVRAVLNNLIESNFIDEKIIEREYSELFKSLTIGDLFTTKLQAQKLMPYIKEIILRQQRRKIPTIIEGSGIIPSLFFPDDTPLPWMNKNIIFVNMYISDANEQKIRRHNRCVERKYTSEYRKIEEQEAVVMREKNEFLHKETLNLGNKVPNVFSIDTAFMCSDDVASKIMDVVNTYFRNIL